MSARNRLFAAFSILFLSGCAAVNAPEGGPRDEKKPSLVSTTPADKTTNFKGQTVTVEFDEDIRPKDLNKELIITPNTGTPYTVKNDRNTLSIEFSKPLEENTTYFMSFRNGIEDITEGNKAPEVTLSFSTGTYLDSARVSGKVLDYITLEPENNITVALYPETDTNNIRDHKPYYFTRTQADGSFQIRNIKAGNYWIFAHNDKNTNEIFDQEAEKIAYFPKPIAIAPKLDSVILKTVRLDNKKPFVLTVENFLDQNIINFNEGVQNVSFRTLDKKPAEKTLLTLADPGGKKITVFAEAGKLPESLIALSTDSSGNAGMDTVKFSLVNKPGIPGSLTFKIDRTELVAEQTNPIKIIFPVPVKVTGPTPFRIKEDTIKTITPSYPKDYTLNTSKTELTLRYKPTAKKIAELILDTTQLQAVNGKPFRKQTQPFTLTRRAVTGSITGTVKTNYKNYTIELLDDKNQVIKTDTNLKKLNYPDLVPGTYRIRVKVDENNDGKWSLGDKKLQMMPEKLYLYPEPISVRSNWEIEDIDLVF